MQLGTFLVVSSIKLVYILFIMLQKHFLCFESNEISDNSQAILVHVNLTIIYVWFMLDFKYELFTL